MPNVHRPRKLQRVARSGDKTIKPTAAAAALVETKYPGKSDAEKHRLALVVTLLDDIRVIQPADR